MSDADRPSDILDNVYQVWRGDKETDSLQRQIDEVARILDKQADLIAHLQAALARLESGDK